MTEPTSTAAPHRARNTVTRVMLGLGLLAVLALGVLTMTTGPLDVEWRPADLAERVRAFGPWAPLVLIAVMAVVVIVPLPTIPVTMTAGLVFGTLWGTVIAAVGALVGALLAFWIARLLGREVMVRWLGERALPGSEAGDRVLVPVVLVARLVPIFSFALVSYAAGLTVMRTVPFALATLLGMLPMTLVYVTAGAAFAVNPLWAGVASVVVIGAMFWLPGWIERRNPWNVRRFLSPPRSHAVSANADQEPRR